MAHVPFFRADGKNRGQNDDSTKEAVKWATQKELLALVQLTESGRGQVGQDSEQDTAQGVCADQIVTGIFHLTALWAVPSFQA